jgi:hypothetical protein
MATTVGLPTPTIRPTAPPLHHHIKIKIPLVAVTNEARRSVADRYLLCQASANAILTGNMDIRRIV